MRVRWAAMVDESEHGPRFRSMSYLRHAKINYITVTTPLSTIVEMNDQNLTIVSIICTHTQDGFEYTQRRKDRINAIEMRLFLRNSFFLITK